MKLYEELNLYGINTGMKNTQSHFKIFKDKVKTMKNTLCKKLEQQLCSLLKAFKAV
jgi:hypothetical protein